MPRAARTSVGGVCYHVINRGNGRQQIFFKDGDYEAFLKAMAHACIEVPMPILSYCLMPNHFHLAVQPLADGDLSRWMHWLLNAHVRRYHKHHGGSGHLWQGRFKSFPIQDDEYLLAVLRYIERNPVRAKLTRRAESWLWSSARYWGVGVERPSFLVEGPAPRPRNWLDLVNATLTPGELETIRRSVNRGTPFGGPVWAAQTAIAHGLESTLRPRGRPRKQTPSETESK